MGKRIRVGREGAVEFFELGFDDFGFGGRCGVVGDIPGSVKDSAKDIGLKTLNDVGWLS